MKWIRSACISSKASFCTTPLPRWCLEAHDLLISKYVAGREKDLEFTRVAMRHGLCDKATLLDRLRQTEVRPELSKIIQARILGDFAPVP